ncbi:hypothetical protein [Caudoviricetes sp.]|nr:hypothetical protein [Caudoviricetes sp.]
MLQPMYQFLSLVGLFHLVIKKANKKDGLIPSL